MTLPSISQCIHVCLLIIAYNHICRMERLTEYFPMYGISFSFSKISKTCCISSILIAGIWIMLNKVTHRQCHPYQKVIIRLNITQLSEGITVTICNVLVMPSYTHSQFPHKTNHFHFWISNTFCQIHTVKYIMNSDLLSMNTTKQPFSMARDISNMGYVQHW